MGCRVKPRRTLNLLEIIVVVVIIGLLIAALIPNRVLP
jgi:hypothetical protein